MSNQTSNIYDVIIIGAGYAGLSAALRLKDSNIKNICIVEGQYRIGGRVWSEKAILDNGDSVYWDAGAAFVGPHQNRLLWLADRYNVEPYKVHCKGKNVTKYNDEVIKYSGLIPKKYTFDHLLSLLDTNHLIAKCDSLCQRINLTDINKSDFNENELISMNKISVVDWIRNETTNKKAADICINAIAANMCLDANNVSLLSFLRDMKGGHGLMHSLENDGGSQDSRFKQRGTYTICQKITSELRKETIHGKDVIQLGKVVEGIRLIKNNGGNGNGNMSDLIEISGIKDNKTRFQMYSRYVIATMPPNLYNSINFVPNISDIRIKYSKMMKMGCVIKVSVFYRKPFWRDMGYSGLIFNASTDAIIIDNELFVASYDDCRPNKDLYPACLACYIVSYQALKESKNHSKEYQLKRRNKLCQAFKKIFDNNDEAINGCIGYAEKIWDSNYYPLIGGGFGPILTFDKNNERDNSDLELIDGGSELCESNFNNLLYFASGENARVFSGYIDGAIESGDECGYQISKKMAKENNSVKVLPYIFEMKDAPPNCQVKVQDIDLSWIERNCIPNAKQFKYGLMAGVAGLTALGVGMIRSKL